VIDLPVDLSGLLTKYVHFCHIQDAYSLPTDLVKLVIGKKLYTQASLCFIHLLR